MGLAVAVLLCLTKAGGSSPISQVWLDLFQRALRESSGDRADTSRAAIWAKGPMCTPAVTASVMFYNRVPKTGSTSIKTATSVLRNPGVKMFSLTNEQVQFAKSQPYRAGRMQAICDLLQEGVERVLISGHVHFTELTESGFFLLHSRPDVPSPYCRPPPHTVYVNMIREPVERLVSNYYYMNSGKHTAELRRLRGYINTGTGSRSLAPRALKGNSEFQLSHAKMLLREAQTGNVTLDACVARMRGWMRARGVTALQAAAATPCAKPLLSLQWPYFCGHAPNCSLGTVLGGDTSGLTRALATLKTRYLLVGLMDQFNASVAALEVLAPQFFGGLERVLLSRRANKTAANVAPLKHTEPTNETTEFLHSLTEQSGDWEFYFQAKKQFHRKMACLIERGKDAA